MTVFSLVKRGRRHLEQWLAFRLGPLKSTTPIDHLEMIHFARLALIPRFPDHRQPRDHLRQVLQLFESNYNGAFHQYIDTFVDAIPDKMKNFWGTSYGYPSGLPLGPFKRYIVANQFPIDHYYVRNPDATVKMIASALRVTRVNAQLLRAAQRLDAPAFAERFRTLVTAIQGDLW